MRSPNQAAALLGLVLAAPPALAAEPATPGRLGEPQTGVLETRNDVDTFVFRLEAGEYAIGLGTTELGVPDDYKAIVVAPGGRVLSEVVSAGEAQSGDEFRAREAGRYLVKLSGAGARNVSYAFTVYPDCGSATGTFCKLKVGATQQRRHAFSQDSDWYKVQLERGRQYALSYESPLGPIFLEFRDARGRSLGVSGEPSSGEPLLFKPGRSGTYFAVVKGTQDSAGIYQVTLAAQ